MFEAATPPWHRYEHSSRSLSYPSVGPSRGKFHNFMQPNTNGDCDLGVRKGATSHNPRVLVYKVIENAPAFPVSYLIEYTQSRCSQIEYSHSYSESGFYPWPATTCVR